ncbi:hypothetical protein [Hyphococcus luteus]|uniref:Uncharacterized protein n=1 Tax=Hyphococcus luteus TaxID=2058213 RepID=A0A2S7K3G0_9PROT|nr:hypothetical protein [Marinicaulis flavus]PQA87027.1 hypothetical protein CW354_13320 [Marinicaulis flavus]
MFEEPRDVSLLAEIKDHLDAHGFGSAIIEDHVAIGLSNSALSPGGRTENIVRVKSLDEARCAVGCCGVKDAR